MYNNNLYNLELYNGNHGAVIELVSSDRISFNGYSLLNGSTVVASDFFVESIERDITFSPVPRGNGQIFNSSFWRKKQIRVVGTLTADTEQELEALIFEFKKQVSAPQGKLEFLRANGDRLRYTATLTNDDPVQRGRNFEVTFAPFNLVFECSTPFGQDVIPTSSGIVSSDLVTSDSYMNEGNAESKTDIVVIVNAASAITKLNFTNTTTGEQIEIETAISSGDIVKFDATNSQVTMNGTAQDFSGTFISASVGNNNFTFAATGSSISYEMSIITAKNYL